jgi:hypothetical protein
MTILSPDISHLLSPNVAHPVKTDRLQSPASARASRDARGGFREYLAKSADVTVASSGAAAQIVSHRQAGPPWTYYSS